MGFSKKILSTKCLSVEQREMLSDFDLVEKSFIKVDLRTDVKLREEVNCAIFTSQNAVEAVFQESKVLTNKLQSVFCVGSKTRRCLERFGIEVQTVCSSAEELARLLIEEKRFKKITFFCGNLRREELPKRLKEEGIEVEEVQVYQTQLFPTKIKGGFTGVLFFSPSAISSYIEAGNSLTTVAFCIGNTTAVTAIEYFEKVYVAEDSTVESTITLLKQTL